MKEKKNKELTNNNFHLRIKKENTVLLFNECMSSGKFEQLNDLFNLCLEIALPQIAEAPLLESNTLKTALAKMETKLVTKFDREMKSLKKEMTKMLILQQVNESIISTVLQAFLYFCNTQNIIVDNEMINVFKETLPKQFIDYKNYLASELLGINENE